MVLPATNEKVLIDVEDVSFSYGEAIVLSHVSFSIRSGDFLAVIGPNGSGKTTLIKIILGLLKPTQGIVRIMSKPVEEFSDWGKVGYIPQKATSIDPFFPVSVREVVGMGLLSARKDRRLSRKNEQQAVERALSQVGMQDLKDWRIGRLSGGQQQRVFIARAVVNEPDILFLDEPTTGVDASTQEHFYDLLDTLNERKKITIVLITHETGIINKHVRQVACLNRTLSYHGTHEEFCSSEAFKQMLAGGHHVISHRH